jgi:hypothetical protein
MSDFGDDILIISTLNDRQNSTDKLSPELKLTESMTEGEIVNADILNDGYSEQLDEWKLIIKFTGSLKELADRYDIRTAELGFGFALISVKRDILVRLENDANVLYVDKPKRLYDELMA